MGSPHSGTGFRDRNELFDHIGAHGRQKLLRFKMADVNSFTPPTVRSSSLAADTSRRGAIWMGTCFFIAGEISWGENFRALALPGFIRPSLWALATKNKTTASVITRCSFH